MRWVTPLFDQVVEGIEFWIAWCHAIDKQEYPTSFQDSRNFLRKLRYIRKVMGSDTTGNAVESAGRKWKLLGVRYLKPGVRYTLRKYEVARFFEHARRQVGDHYLRHVWSNRKGRVSAPSSDIKHLKLWIPFSQLD